MSVFLKGLAFLCLISTSTTFADVIESGKIERIIVEGNNIVSVWLDGTDKTEDCGGGARWTLQTTDPHFDAKYSMLLAAANTGSTVKLFHLGPWGCGTWNSNKIYYISQNF